MSSPVAASSGAGSSGSSSGIPMAQRRIATEALIWRLKQRRAALGPAAMLELLGPAVSTPEALAMLDCNGSDHHGTTLLLLLLQTAESLDRMDEDDSAEVAAFADIVQPLFLYAWSDLAVNDAPQDGGGESALRLAEEAYAKMVQRRKAHNVDQSLEGSAISLLLGLIKQTQRAQREANLEVRRHETVQSTDAKLRAQKLFDDHPFITTA